ncbi:aspartate aminotransferase family protein [Leucobacter sp. gxy201]|uniref:aspartate aminotransferase family protein n=1 Tax=Leucobacter sp. gxy201 TaxID=2957200 RepID=UPI003DA1BC74
MSSSAFENRLLAQRNKLHTSPEQLSERVEKSHYGPEAKSLLQRQVSNESTGAIGFALWDVPPAIVRGEGTRVFDADGKSYIDMLVGFSVNNLGHSHPDIVEAITKQANTLIQYFDLPTPPRAELSERLVDLSPIPDSRVAFGTTGSDAIDLSIKIARWYTGAPMVLTTYGGYHGTTQGTMAMTAKGGMWSYFYPVGPHDTAHAKIPYSYPYRSAFGASPETDAEACLEFIQRMFRGKETPFGDGRGVSNVAAILVEPMQASAGYIMPGEGYLQGLRELADEHGILLIFDEIQTGMGRSGKMWASEHEGIVPDLFTTSKGLASGMPISALIGRSDILSSWGPGAHVGTFSGTPLASAAANATLDVYARDGIVENAARMGDYFRERLAELQDKHTLLGHVDGRGLFIGLELVMDRATKEPAPEATTAVLNACVREGLLFEKGGYYYNRLQLIPALIIDKAEIDQAIDILDRAFTEAANLVGVK